MNFKNIGSTITRSASRVLIKTKKNSPHLMFGAGIVGVVGTVVLASKATLELDNVLDQHERIEMDIQDAIGSELKTGGIYAQEHAERDQRKNMIKTSLNVAKLYAPAAAVGVASIGLLTGAHVTLHRRNVAMMAAYTAVSESLRAYRARVTEELGPDKDREFMYGVAEKEVYSEKENGEPVVDRIKVASGTSGYARFFEPSNPNYAPNPDHNIYFLRSVQKFLNDKLMARGHVFLNEVFDELGMDRMPYGAVVGWVYNKNGKGAGANYIDFGIWDDDRMEQFHAFVTGREDSILLDFNVDPDVIWNKI